MSERIDAAAAGRTAAVGNGSSEPRVPFPDGVPGGNTARLVWAVLAAAVEPLTANALASAASVSRSSVSKALNALELAGQVVRFAGEPQGKVSVADLWALPIGMRATSSTPVTTSDEPEPVGNWGEAEGESSISADDGGTAVPGTAVEPARSDPQAVEGIGAAGAEPDQDGGEKQEAMAPPCAVADEATAGSAASDALAAVLDEGDMVADMATPPGGMRVVIDLPAPDPVDGASSPIPAQPAPVVAVPVTPGRLQLGELRSLVLNILLAHYPREFGPTELSRALDGRSSGAIANALVKLCEAGEAVCTNPAPKRYRAVPPVTTDETPRYSA